MELLETEGELSRSISGSAYGTWNALKSTIQNHEDGVDSARVELIHESITHDLELGLEFTLADLTALVVLGIEHLVNENIACCSLGEAASALVRDDCLEREHTATVELLNVSAIAFKGGLLVSEGSDLVGGVVELIASRLQHLRILL